MLKWLKQKPMHGHSAVTAEKITDDPLATIQVHLNQKKSKNKSNEIYAVSRVNPLFEEEDSKGTFSPGNNSGSSGYDSGPSDDDTPASASASPKLHLFRDTDDVLIHHEAALLGPNGRPVLQILEKNPNYVKSISVAVPTRRPLSPIAEQSSSANGDSSSARSKSSSPSGPLKISAIPIPKRDNVGVAKVLQKDSRYVQSIRIGPGTRNGRLGGNGPPPVTRKHSVTFAEKVDVVDGKSPSRKASLDQDSIVTESLLMMTSKDSRRLSDYANVNRRLSSASGKSVVSSSGDEGKEPKPDLQAFSSSIRKNRPIKQMPSNSNHRSSEKTSSSGENEIDEESAEDHENDERSSSASSQRESPRRPRSVVSGKSPFGGIADHYAAAKEIAKEIESYSNGSKTSKKSLVRDLLLSSRGRHYNQQQQQNVTNRGGGVNGEDFRTSHILSAYSTDGVEGGFQHPSHAHLAYKMDNEYRGGKKKEPWELVRVQQVYVKANASANSSVAQHQQLQQPHPPEGQDHIHSINFQSNSQQVPIYDALPGSSRLSEDSDSGNSTDRSPKEVRLEIDKGKDGESRLLMSTTATVHNARSESNSSDSSSGSTESSSVEASPKNIVRKNMESVSESGEEEGEGKNKVMIVTGDSQNVVVDLSGVPDDLREAIISGTALITLPEGLGGLLKPGYTMINIPPGDFSGSEHIYVNGSSSNSNRSSSPSNNPSNHHSSSVGKGKSASSSSNSGINGLRTKRDSTSSQNHILDLGSVSVHGLLEQSKLYGPKNKAQIWDVMQNSVHGSMSPGKPYRDKKGKRITTVLPFHPNEDSNISPDFTLEGHRMAVQMRKVQVGKKRRCICRICGMLFFLVAFLGVLVALSLIYTRGQKYFGSVGHTT